MVGYRLTQKRKDALRLRAQGLENKQIADVLNISCEAVRLRLEGACSSLNAVNVSHAVAIAITEGIISLKDGGNNEH